MKSFKILVIAHSLKSNKIANCGNIVSESQLTSPASELIEAGFIEEVFDTEDLTTEDLTTEDESSEIKNSKKKK